MPFVPWSPELMSEYLVLRDVLILSSMLISDSCLSDLSSPKCVVERVVNSLLPSQWLPWQLKKISGANLVAASKSLCLIK
jgi:hypothetical protein